MQVDGGDTLGDAGLDGVSRLHAEVEHAHEDCGRVLLHAHQQLRQLVQQRLGHLRLVGVQAFQDCLEAWEV